MKYIRTNEGIFEQNENFTITYHELEDDIREADTIEELCDAFIIIDEDKKKYVYLKEDGLIFDMIQDLGNWCDRTCYGAIWTDKGLIYVAKMNDKGELELL